MKTRLPFAGVSLGFGLLCRDGCLPAFERATQIRTVSAEHWESRAPEEVGLSREHSARCAILSANTSRPSALVFYSFNWWVNILDKPGERLYGDGLTDLYVASRQRWRRTLGVIPSLDLIVSWNDAPVLDHDDSPGDPHAQTNCTVRLMRKEVIEGGRSE